MSYIMIERVIYDAMVSALRQCRDVLAKAVQRKAPSAKLDWIDGQTAQSILQCSRRSMATLRADVKIGYSMIEGKVFYPVEEIGGMLNRQYLKYERDSSPPVEG